MLIKTSINFCVIFFIFCCDRLIVLLFFLFYCLYFDTGWMSEPQLRLVPSVKVTNLPFEIISHFNKTCTHSISFFNLMVPSCTSCCFGYMSMRTFFFIIECLLRFYNANNLGVRRAQPLK